MVKVLWKLGDRSVEIYRLLDYKIAEVYRTLG